MAEQKVIKRARLLDKYDSSYCPFCRRELRNEGKDFREILKPLWKVTTAEPMTKADGFQFDYLSDYYTCDRECCKGKRYTFNQIVNENIRRFDGTKYSEKSKPFMAFNDKTNQWEERILDAE